MGNQNEVTENHDLNKPSKFYDAPDPTWSELLNENFQKSEQRLVVRDAEGNRNDYTPYDDALFVATDTGALYLGDGSSWNEHDLQLSDLVVSGVLTIEDSGADPSSDGEITNNGGSIKAQSGGVVKNFDNIGGGSGSGAPTDASYITYSSEGGLSAERVFALASGISPSDGDVLKYNDTSGEWEIGTDLTGGGSGFDSPTAVTSGSSPYAASNNESLWVDTSGGAVTIDLPTPSQGVEIRIKHVAGSNDCTVSRNGSEDIDDAATDFVVPLNASFTFESDGTDWETQLRELPNPEDGATGQVIKVQSDGTYGFGTDQQGIGLSEVASGSTALSSGTGTADTGVSTDSDKYEVFINPGGADISMSFDGSGSNYQIHFEEVDTNVGNPTVDWSLIRL